MSFSGYKSLIEEGDTVILYISFNVMYPVLVTSKVAAGKSGELVDHVRQTTYGALRVKDLIGRRFGTRVRLSKGGYAYALYPTPELWTKTLPHRTQILYATDIAMIALQLELKPGSVVVESGTGSGSLSHSLLRTIAPSGHLHTFDFHEKRVEVAREEFTSHGVGHLVTARQRDVCRDGFDLEAVADAVFLDLPHPWDAVPHAKRAMKSTGGRLCSFSPCIEQVQKTCETLREEGFTEISTLECLLREFQVRKITLPVFDESRESLDVTNSRKRKLDEEEEDEKDQGNEEDVVKTAAAKDLASPLTQDISFVTGMPLLSMPGHTGYLTFATLPAKKTTTV